MISVGKIKLQEQKGAEHPRSRSLRRRDEPPFPILDLEGFLEVLPEVVSNICGFYDADVRSNVFCLLRLALMISGGGGVETRPLSLRVHITVYI